jgi:hypothetical protein
MDYAQNLDKLNDILASCFYERAKFLAELGIRVTPALPKTKRPCKKDWGETSTTDLAQLRRLNEEDSQYNSFAVANDEFFLVDPDDSGRLSLIERDQKLPLTLTVSGSKGPGCEHRYFKQTAYSKQFGNIEVSSSQVNESGKRLRLIDVQANGTKGVVGPGSLHPKGMNYRVQVLAPIPPIPDWAVNRILEIKKEQDEQYRRFVLSFNKGALPLTDKSGNAVLVARKNQLTCREVAAKIMARDERASREANQSLSRSMGFEHSHEADAKFAIYLQQAMPAEAPALFAKFKLHEDRDENYCSMTLAKAQAYVSEQPDVSDIVFKPNLGEVDLTSIPEDAMYGIAKEWAKSIKSPISCAYVAVLAAICGKGIEPSGNIRTNLYVATLGDVGTGKSVASKRATELFSGNVDQEFKGRIVTDTIASDRGLLFRFQNTQKEDAGQSFLLLQDELRELMSKGAILNSTLISLLCKLYYEDRAGNAVSKQHDFVNLRLSILGNVKVKTPAEFSEVFGSGTAHGFYDRCLFGIASEPWEFTPWEVIEAEFNPSKPFVPESAYKIVNEWARGKKSRTRLKEIALRVAFVTAAVNRDQSVTAEALDAAIKLMEWQETIREVYTPAKGADAYEECVNAILDLFEKDPSQAWKWRDLDRKLHLTRKYARVIKTIRNLLTIGEDSKLGFDAETKMYYLKKEK